MFGTDVGVEIVLVVGHIGTVITQILALARMMRSEVFGEVHLTGGEMVTLSTLVRLGSSPPLSDFLHLVLTLLVLNILIAELTPAVQEGQGVSRVMRAPVSVERLSVVTPVGAAGTRADQSQSPHVNSLLVAF